MSHRAALDKHRWLDLVISSKRLLSSPTSTSFVPPCHLSTYFQCAGHPTNASACQGYLERSSFHNCLFLLSLLIFDHDISWPDYYHVHTLKHLAVYSSAGYLVIDRFVQGFQASLQQQRVIWCRYVAMKPEHSEGIRTQITFLNYEVKIFCKILSRIWGRCLSPNPFSSICTADTNWPWFMNWHRVVSIKQGQSQAAGLKQNCHWSLP